MLLSYLVLILSGCFSSGGTVFNLTDKNYNVTPGSLAVVAGKSQNKDHLLSKYIIKELREKSSFRIMTYKDIEKRIPNYYYTNIVGKWGNPPKGQDNSAWLPPSNKAKVDRIQKKLGTKYVFVVWTGRMGSITHMGDGGSSTHIAVHGRLLSYPESKVRGYTVKAFSKGGYGISGMINSFQSTAKQFDQLLKEAAEKIAEKIIQITNSKI